MRVLQLIDSLEAGGAERMAVNLANALVSRLEKSYLCTTRKEGLLKAGLKQDVGYLYLRKRHAFDISAFLRLHRFVKREGVSLIHAHSTSFFLASLLKFLQPNLHIIWHDHYGNSEHIAQRPKQILRFCSRYFSCIFTVNAILSQWARTHLHCKTVVCLPNFVTRHEMAPVTHLKGLAGKRILCLANMRPQKDHITLLKAFKMVHDLHPEWTLHCVGQEFNDLYISRVKRVCKDMDLEASVFFYGSCPDIDYIIHQSTIGVLPSLSEGLPLALLEYGMGRLASIATDVGDCRDIITLPEEGILIPSGDVKAMADALMHYMTQDFEREQAAERLHRKTALNYSEAASLDRLTKVYLDLHLEHSQE